MVQVWARILLNIRELNKQIGFNNNRFLMVFQHRAFLDWGIMDGLNIDKLVIGY